nr:hypothetical protein 2 [bacterium]
MSIRTALGLQKKSQEDTNPLEAHGAALNRMGSATDGLDTTEGVPEKWEEMARLAWHYFVSEPIVNNAVNAWRVFAVGEQIQPMADNADLQQDVRGLHRRLAMDKFVRDMVLQLLVKGECAAYKQYGGKKSGDGYRDYDRITCLNPIGLTYKLDDETGEIEEIKQKAKRDDQTAGGMEKEISLEPAQFFRAKWDSPDFNLHGVSIVQPAFESIQLMRHYRNAEKAIAQRWTTPLRFISVGGKFGDKIITPKQEMIEKIRDILDEMDPKQGVVVPYYVDVKTYGTEGEVLRTEEKVKEVKSDIIVALGFVKSLVTGEGPNFATASVGFKKIIIMLSEIKRIVREILDWVYLDWLEMQGHEDAVISYQFDDLDLAEEQDRRKMYMELYDRGLVSRATLQSRLGLQPSVEDENYKDEESRMSRILKPEIIASLTLQDVLTRDEARKYLGLAKDDSQNDKKDNPQSDADVEALYDEVNRDIHSGQTHLEDH